LLANVELAAQEVDVAHPQSEQLALAQARTRGHDHGGAERIGDLNGELVDLSRLEGY
jgi:hypothetical protein